MNGVPTQSFYLVQIASDKGTSTGGFITIEYDYGWVGGKPNITRWKTGLIGQLDDMVGVRSKPNSLYFCGQNTVVVGPMWGMQWYGYYIIQLKTRQDRRLTVVTGASSVIKSVFRCLKVRNAASL